MSDAQLGHVSRCPSSSRRRSTDKRPCMNSATVLSSGHCIPKATPLYATSHVERVLAEAQALPFSLPEAFRAHVEGMVASGDDVAAKLRGADVGLAWACGRRIPAALVAFEARHLGDLRVVHARARGEKAAARRVRPDDAREALRG